MRLRTTVLLCALLALGANASAQKGSHRSLSGGSGSSHKGGHYTAPRAPSAERAPAERRASVPRVSSAPSTTDGVARDSKGRIARSETAKHDFEKATGHPGGWKGHVVDHVIPLACGGTDAPENMQWQTAEEGKAKDKVERVGCPKK